jgi:hypothetical protein
VRHYRCSDKADAVKWWAASRTYRVRFRLGVWRRYLYHHIRKGSGAWIWPVIYWAIFFFYFCESKAIGLRNWHLTSIFCWSCEWGRFYSHHLCASSWRDIFTYFVMNLLMMLKKSSRQPTSRRTLTNFMRAELKVLKLGLQWYGNLVSVICVYWYLSRYSDWLRAGRSDDRGSIPDGCSEFFLRYHVRTGYGVHPASCSVGIRDCFSGCKAAGAWSWPLTSI